MNSKLRSAIKVWSLAVVTVAFAGAAAAQGAANRLPLSAFLDTQGSQNIYIPPVPDYWGWTAPPPGVKTPASSYVGGNGASCDYAGLANEWLVQQGHADLGTAFSGSVTTRSLADGRMLVQVELHTINALTFAFRITTPDFGDFAYDPLIFGARAQDVAAGAPPALGECHASFAWTQMPGDLVDFNHAWDAPGFEIVNISFRANAQGLLADGRTGRLIISETGFARTSFKGATADWFPAEFVEVRPTGN